MMEFFLLKMYKEKIQQGGMDSTSAYLQEAQLPVYMGLANEEGYPHEGVFEFAESAVDTETGTMELRGIFENDEQPPALLPGLFARIRVPVASRADMLLVTERAVAQDQGGTYLLVVNSDHCPSGVVSPKEMPSSCSSASHTSRPPTTWHGAS